MSQFVVVVKSPVCGLPKYRKLDIIMRRYGWPHVFESGRILRRIAAWLCKAMLVVVAGFSALSY